MNNASPLVEALDVDHRDVEHTRDLREHRSPALRAAAATRLVG